MPITKKEPTTKKTATKPSKEMVEQEVVTKATPEKELKTEKKVEIEKIDTSKENSAQEKEEVTPKEKVEKKKALKKGFISGTGRRKTSTARVFLWQTKGDFIVNDKFISEYFPAKASQVEWEKPFHAIGVSHPEAKYSLSIKVAGSGKSGQLGAVRHGISRALAKISEENRKSLRKAGLLTRDSRMVERKKYFLHKARKRPQYSKR